MLRRLTVATFLLLCAVPAAGTAPPPLNGAQVGPACRTTAIPYPQNALAAAAGSLLARVPRRLTRRAAHAGGQARRDDPNAGLPAVGDRKRRRRDLGGRPRPTLAPAHLDQDEQGRRSASTCRRRRSTSGAEAASRGSRSTTAAQWRASLTSTNRVGARVFVGDGPSGFATGASTWVLSHRDGALVRFDGTTAEDAAPSTGGRPAHAGADDARRRLALDHGSRSRPRAGRPGHRRRARHDRDRRGGHRRRRRRRPTGGHLRDRDRRAARRSDRRRVSWVDPATGTVLRTSEATSATSLTGVAVAGGKLVVLDGLHGRLLTLTP